MKFHVNKRSPSDSASRRVYPCGIRVNGALRSNQQIGAVAGESTSGAGSKFRVGCALAPETAGINPAARGRSGSTLTEVLVALMISSIGLVSVMTLFPMSVLRSVKATQVTSATDVRLNAEAAIDLYPDIIKHPDSRVLPYIYSPANNVPAADPPWATMQSIGVKNFIVDPLGFAAVQNLKLTIGANPAAYQNRPEHFFGNDPSGGNAPPWPSNQPPGTPWQILPRYPLNWRNMDSAHYLVTLPDSWLVQYEGIGGATLGTAPGNYTQITIPGLNFQTSLSGTFPNLPAPSVRIVIFSPDTAQVQAQERFVTSYTAAGGSTTFQWNEIAGQDVNANGTVDQHLLPASFVSLFPTNAAGNPILGKVRVELQEPRYTWLLTVRQSSPTQASVDVVVYFSRTIENIAVDELLYQAIFVQGSTQVTVTYPTANNPATGLPLKPFMRRGGFVFDANNAYWYRINNVTDDNKGNAVLTLEVPANASSLTSIPQAPPRAMFPRGVVDVFPLGTKTVQ